MTMLSSFGGGCTSIIYTFVRTKGKVEVLDIINGILGSLVSVTAGCFLYAGSLNPLQKSIHIIHPILLYFLLAWEALLIGSIGALLACLAMPLIDKV